jgi:hypothetical protein
MANMLKNNKVDNAPRIKKITMPVFEMFFDLIKLQEYPMGNNPPVIAGIKIMDNSSALLAAPFMISNRTTNGQIRPITNHIFHDVFVKSEIS